MCFGKNSAPCDVHCFGVKTKDPAAEQAAAGPDRRFTARSREPTRTFSFLPPEGGC